MEPDGPNPVQIQTCPPNKLADEPLPLVLLHDGGGTTFSYFFLDHLDRDVWALHNPNFFTGEPFAGGMDAMARHYIELIAKAGISGKILIGGQSPSTPPRASLTRRHNNRMVTWRLPLRCHCQDPRTRALVVLHCRHAAD